MTTHTRSPLIRWPNWRRVLSRTVVMAVLVAAISVAFARPASADVCADAPDPVAPKSGLPGMLTTTPKQIPDKAPDPFTDKKTSIGQVYGYNWNWSNYDLGCGPDFLRDPVAVTNTQTGNVILSIVGAVLAGLASLEQMAKSSSLNWFSTVIGGIATKLRVPVLTIWLPLAMLGVGLIVAFRAKRTSYAETMRTLLIIALASTMAVFALAFPAVASRTVDRGVVSVSNAAGAEFSSSPSDAVTRGSAYRTWLTGNFGDPDSAVAKQLGPELMDATHYSWSDMKRIQADPDAKKQIDDAKAAEFKNVAKQLKQEDPAAYEEFTGRGERTGPALMGVVVSLAMSLFVALSMIMVLIARMMMQGLALAAPLAAVVGVLPTQRSVLSRMWDLFAAAIVAVAKFVIAGGVMTMVLGAIETNTNLGAGAQLFWIVVATVVGLVLTRPLHSFKSIVPGLDPNRSYLRTALNGVTNYLGARLGTESALDDLPHSETTKPSEPTGEPTAPPSARESLPALPSPDWDRSESTRIVQMDKATQADSAETSPSQTGRSWPGVVASPPMAQLPAPPRQLEADPVSTGVRRPTLTALPSATADLDTSRPNPTPELPGGSSGEGTTAPESPSGDRPRSDGGPAESGSEVVYPTGIIVADDEMPLYRRSQLDAGDGETYIPMAEPELAEDGTEHALVTYHSHAGADDAST